MPARTSKATDPWAALDAIMAQEAEPQGKEWFTLDQMAARYGFSHQTARREAKDLVSRGLAEQWHGRMGPRNQPGYKFRLKTKGAS